MRRQRRELVKVSGQDLATSVSTAGSFAPVETGQLNLVYLPRDRKWRRGERRKSRCTRGSQR